MYKYREKYRLLKECGVRTLSNPAPLSYTKWLHAHLLTNIYRVYRVPGFLSSRPNWLLTTLHPQASVAPPAVPWGGGILACVRGANSDKGTDTLVL